jgi:hypothetical protein
MRKKGRKKEIESFIKELEEQPGLEELTIVYGNYIELLEISNRYLNETKPKSVVSVSDSTSIN